MNFYVKSQKVYSPLNPWTVVLAEQVIHIKRVCWIYWENKYCNAFRDD